MATNYEEIYRSTPHALGDANEYVVAFFAGHDPGLTVLDIGCGQGRDALALGRAGHAVHGIDLAPSGIAQMVSEAERDGLTVTGEVADVVTYRPDRKVDVLLIDRTLHMLPSEEVRIRVLSTLIRAVRPGGWLLLLDEPSNMAAFERVLVEQSPPWTIDFRGTRGDRNRPVTGRLFARHPV